MDAATAAGLLLIMVPLAFNVAFALLAARFDDDADPALLEVTTTVGVLAAGPVPRPRPLAVPRAVPGPHRRRPGTTPATRAAVEVVFQSVNRYLGVAVGEHLGHALTGAWTTLVGTALTRAPSLRPGSASWASSSVPS
jgi:hypothetical protein